jgi:hypothetical protein
MPSQSSSGITQPMSYERTLRSTDRREQFALNVERGGRTRARLKYQTRVRRVFVLARLELGGPRHRNPPEAAYKGGEWIGGTHLHLYREGFEDRVAFELADVPFWVGRDVSHGVIALEHFLRFCGVTDWPPIQESI